MPRAERILYNNAYYHVMNRGRGRQTIFPDKVYYEAFLQGVAEAHSRFGLEIHAYCLLGNHYHLLVKTPRGNLGRSMRHINGLYTQRHNRLKRTDGQLFRGRYHAILIEQDSYLAALTRYIHRNPIATKVPLVKRLETYPWSSYPIYLNKQPCPAWLYREETYGLLADRQRYVGYRAFVEEEAEDDVTQRYRQHRYPAILGSKAFKRRVYTEEDNKDLVRRVKRQETQLPTIKQIVAEVARQMGVEEQAIYRVKRGERQEARWMAMYLSQELGGKLLKEIAKAFHLRHVSGVTHQTRKFKQLKETDYEVKSKLKLATQHLTP